MSEQPENATFEDLTGGDGQDDTTTPFNVQPQSVSRQIQTSVPDPDRLTQLREEFQRLTSKINNALANDYEGYRLDTDQNGNAYFGNKSMAAYEREKLRRDDLRHEIREAEQAEQQFYSLAQQSTSSAAQIAKRIYSQKIGFVNKPLRPKVTAKFREYYDQTDWSIPNLHSDEAKSSLLRMYFNDAAQEIWEQHKRTSRTTPGSIQDADTGDESGDGPTEQKKVNEFGHEEGSVAWKISERFKERKQSSGIAADVYRRQKEQGNS